MKKPQLKDVRSDWRAALLDGEETEGKKIFSAWKKSGGDEKTLIRSARGIAGHPPENVVKTLQDEADPDEEPQSEKEVKADIRNAVLRTLKEILGP